MTASANATRYDLMDLSVFVEDREFELYDRLRAEHPVYWNAPSELGPGFWALTRYDDIQEATGDKRLSSAEGTQILERKLEGAGLNSLHNMDDPEHAKLRKITIPHLRAVKIRQWNEVIQSSVTLLLDEAQARSEPFDLVAQVSSRLPMLVLAQVLGVPRAEAPKMVDWTNRLVSSDPDEQVAESELVVVRTEALDYFSQLAEQRRRNPTHDLLSVLVTATKDGTPLTAGELAAYILMLVAAGNETTRQALSGGTIALHRTPGAWERLEADTSLLDSAVEEILRYVSPIACMRRTATEDLVIRDQHIAAGDKVVLWFAAANRDPAVFDQPHEFRLDRTPNEHMTFGWGVHYCLGAHLARAEIKAYFAEVLRRGLRFELAGDPQRVRHNIFRSWSHVPVALSSALSSSRAGALV